MKKIVEEINNIANDALSDEISNINKFRKTNKNYGNIIVLLAIVLVIVVTAIFAKNMLASGIANFTTSFTNSSKESKDAAYNKYYKEAYTTAYEKALKENAINNTIYITVDEIREMSEYEVLSVIEDAIVKETEEQKKDGIYSWTRYKGKGIFTVDLEQSEIIVDHENLYVSIKIPHPKMKYVPLPTETETLLYVDNRTTLFWEKKDSRTGYSIAQEQESKGNIEIRDKLSDDDYVERAEKAAINSLTSLVKTLNSSVSNELKIEISFND